MKNQCSVMPIDPGAKSPVPEPNIINLGGSNNVKKHIGRTNSKPVTSKQKTKQKH